MRDRAVPEGGRGLRGDAAEGRDPVRRTGFGARPGRAARAARHLPGGRAGARHLLRRAGDGGAARRRGRGRPSPRVRPRRGAGDGGDALVRGRLAQGRALPRMDEPRRPRHAAAGRLPRGRHLAERADRHDRGRATPVLRHAISPRGRAYAPRRRAHTQLRAQDRRLQGRLDHARLQGRGGREDPRAGRQRPRDLRALRRRRFRPSPRS